MLHILTPAVFSHQGGILWARKALLPSMRECSQPQLWEPPAGQPSCSDFKSLVIPCPEGRAAQRRNTQGRKLTWHSFRLQWGELRPSPQSRKQSEAVPGPELQHPEVLWVLIFCFQVDLLPKGSTQLLQKTPPAREQVINPLAYRDVSGINKKHFKLLNPQRIASHKYFIENSYKRFN